jgi:signal transduction histidine kinase
MNWLRSFRWRILLGAILWTMGLIPLLHLLFLAIHHQMRLMPRHGIEIFLAFSIVCTVGGVMQMRVGLLPFGHLRRQLARLQEGSGRRIEGVYPSEVQPLVNDLNSLLEHREQIVARALAKAGDLAHGLKTPLAVLAQEAERVEAAGHHETASTISREVERMRRQVDYHLAQARATTPGSVAGPRCPVRETVDGLTRTLERIYADRQLEIVVEVEPQHAIRGQREDLEEMLGNLLDNACKWAKSRVRIESLEESGGVVLTVDDDGPGLPLSMRARVVERGVRADEAAPGSGLGLAIVRDLAELYQGTIALEDSPMGGLRARLRLPS